MFAVILRAWNGLGTSLSSRSLSTFYGRLLTGERKFIALAISNQRTGEIVTHGRSYHEVHLDESEMEENFIKGWGKGGQSVNKTSNCVQLKHKPTGTIIKCHESRSLARNRVIAREQLKQKLDFLYNGKESVISQEMAKTKKRKADYARKRRKREEAIGSRQQEIQDGPNTKMPEEN